MTPAPNIFGIKIPLVDNGPFVQVSPKARWRFSESFAAAMHPETGDLAVLDQGRLVILRRNADGTYEHAAEKQFEDEQGEAVIGMAGDTVVVGTQEGRVWLVDRQTLERKHDYRATGSSDPYQAKAWPDGRWFAVLFHNGRLALYDQAGELSRMLRGISAVAFDRDGSLWVADRTAQLTQYGLEPFSQRRRYAPQLDTLQSVYRYLIVPVYTVFPKPGELGNVVAYVLTDKETASVGPPGQADLREPHVQLNIWGPILSSLAFVGVMLGYTCWYVHRIDI